MPLRCLDHHGTTLEANAFTDDEWQALRLRSRSDVHLRMPCCPTRAVLKTSPLGTRFFAHKARGSCDWKPETEAHRHLKMLALEAARDAGWEAQTETTGNTLDGERWTADVLAWKRDEKLAVEIQWSGQSNEETWRRQRRYQRSGVKGVWLLRQPGWPISEELPAACLGGSVSEGLNILVPRWEGLRARDRKNSSQWTQILHPVEFMKALFERRYLFGIAHVDKVDLDIRTGVMDCWKCRRPTRIVTFLVGQIGPHAVTLRLEDAEHLPELVARIQGVLRLRKDIGAIRERYSKTVGHSYVANACAHCDALIGRFFEHEAYYCQERSVGTVELNLQRGGRDVLADDTGRWAVWDRNIAPQYV